MIYFVQAASGPVKIGFTNDWQKRRAALQSGSPERHVLLLLMPGEPADEKALHRVFVEHRVRGEWFAPVPALLAYIDSRSGEAIHLKRSVLRSWAASSATPWRGSRSRGVSSDEADRGCAPCRRSGLSARPGGAHEDR